MICSSQKYSPHEFWNLVLRGILVICHKILNSLECSRDNTTICHAAGRGGELESPVELPMFVCGARTIRPASHNSSGSRKWRWQRVGEFSRSLRRPPALRKHQRAHTRVAAWWCVYQCIRVTEETGARSFIVSTSSTKEQSGRADMTVQKMWFMGRKCVCEGSSGRRKAERGSFSHQQYNPECSSSHTHHAQILSETECFYITVILNKKQNTTAPNDRKII